MENLWQAQNTLKTIYSPSGLGGAQDEGTRATLFSLLPLLPRPIQENARGNGFSLNKNSLFALFFCELTTLALLCPQISAINLVSAMLFLI